MEKKQPRNIFLRQIAHARSGDKGNTANVGVLALGSENYEILKRELTAERVEKHFSAICLGGVERYELPNLYGLNFLLRDSLDGGGTVSLRSDAQGKSYGLALLRMKIEVTEEEFSRISSHAIAQE